MSKCPHCGVELREGSMICWVCQRRLFEEEGFKKTRIESRTELRKASSPIVSLLLAILLFLALMLTGYVIFELDSRIGGVYALLSSLILGWLGAKGRYMIPTQRQYLFTMLVALIPVIGTAYAAFFAGKSVAEQRRLRYLVYLLLVLSIGLFIFWKMHQEGLDFRGMLALLDRSATPTSTAIPSATLIITPSPSVTLHHSPTVLSTSMATAIIEKPPLEDCLHWSVVTLDLVGQNVCIYGDYLGILQKQDQTYVLYFDDEPGMFQVWSYPRPFEPYLPNDATRCVVVRGWIKTSGVRPIVVIGTQGKIEPCP